MRRWCIIIVSALVAALALPLAAAPASGAEIAHPQIVSSTTSNLTPHVLDGDVQSIAQVGNLIILGGSFTQVSNAQRTQTYQRRNMVAFDATTGAISQTFNPSPDSGVTAVIPAASGNRVYVGGNFNTISGETRRKVALIDVTTGANVAGFRNVAANGVVKDLRLVGNRLWVAGAFTSMSGSSQRSLATLNATTGNADGFMALPIEGQHNGGTTQVIKIDVTADGSRLVGIGNFLTVGGQDRRQIFMLDTTGGSASVANWQTGFYATGCAGVFNTYMRDLDFAPDGSFFVVTTTGAYGGSTSSCDTQSRFNTARTGTGIRPEWINTTGGDTTYAVEVTGSAVYVGGHMRWENNPFAGDSAGPGAVAREGIAALDPSNGMPFAWNPGRTRGVGVFDMLATDTGLWIASDTERVGGFFRGRVAFFPLQGGTAVTPTAAPDLPSNVVMLAPQATAANGPVLYRVNAAGGALGSLDSGLDWAADDDSSSPYRVGGANAAGYGPVPTVDSTVPASTPAAVFDQERWDDGGAPEMQWSFPVAAGTPIQVRLYFANRYDGTASVGSRVFDVSLDGALVLDDFDIVAAAGGTNTGTMRAFNTTSDGTVNIDFGHVVENPLINAIEIVRTDVAAVDTSKGVRTVAFSGTAVGATSNQTGAIDWTTTRGAFMLNGTVYLGNADGTFVRRTYNGTTWGSPVAVDTQDEIVQLDAWRTNVSRLTGMFFDNGRIYYTQSGSNTLRMRYFTAQNDVVGAAEYSSTPTVSGLNLANSRGMFLAGGSVFVVQLDGSLLRVGWQDGAFVPGTATTVSGPAIDGVSWLSKAPFAYQSSNGSVPNFPPTVNAAVTCEFQSCTFSSAGTVDVGGSIASYLWNFGDGATSTEANPSHVYAASGDYTVTLTATDNAGASATATVQKQVEFRDAEPTASFTSSCTNRVCSFDAAGSSDPEGPIAQYSWTFGDGSTATGAQVSRTYAADGTYNVTLSVRDSASQTASTTKAVAVQYVFTPPTASFTASCTALACTFDGSASSDADGPITAFAWTFGDGGTGSGAVATRTFAASGTYNVTLAVTDSQGVQTEKTQAVQVTAVANGITFVASANSNRNATTHPTVVPAAARVGDVMVLLYAANSTNVTVTPPAGWTQAAANQSTNGVLARVWTKTVTAADLGSTVTATSSAIMKADATLLVYRGVNTSTPVAGIANAFASVNATSFTTPQVAAVANGTLVSYWAAKGNVTDALTAPAGSTVRSSSSGVGSGNMTALATETGSLAAGTTGGLTATTGTATNKAFLLSLVLRPAG